MGRGVEGLESSMGAAQRAPWACPERSEGCLLLSSHFVSQLLHLKIKAVCPQNENTPPRN
jgi:hypothetical protein